MTEQRASPLGARSILGLAIIAFGVVLTLDNLGYARVDNFWQFWPVILLLVGASMLMQRQWGGAFFFFLLGTAFLLPLVIDDFEIGDLWRYWPLALIALGVSMVLRSFSRSGEREAAAARERERRESDSEDEASGDVQAYGILSTARRNVTGVFRHGDLTGILGACEIDLTGAELPPEGAVVEILAFWGGVVLRIPDHWVVDPQLAVLMGAIEDNTKQLPAADGGRLTIKGLALMGGFEIRN